MVVFVRVRLVGRHEVAQPGCCADRQQATDLSVAVLLDDVRDRVEELRVVGEEVHRLAVRLGRGECVVR